MIKVLANNQTDTKDNELVLQCQLGDRLAFAQLYRRYQQRVRSTLYQLCGEQLLDDLVQEVFLRVWKGLPKLRQTSYFSTWLYRIAWNVATDQRRQFAKKQQEQYCDNLIERSLFPSQTQTDSLDLMQLHYQDLVKRGLQTLNLEHRVVLVLHDLEDQPQKEIAKILEIPLGTVKSRLFHARRAIRKFLEQQGES